MTTNNGETTPGAAYVSALSGVQPDIPSVLQNPDTLLNFVPPEEEAISPEDRAAFLRALADIKSPIRLFIHYVLGVAREQSANAPVFGPEEKRAFLKELRDGDSALIQSVRDSLAAAKIRSDTEFKVKQKDYLKKRKIESLKKGRTWK